MFKYIAIIITAFFVAFTDTYLVGVPPVSPTIGVLIQALEHKFLITIACGISVGFGTTCSLFFFRTIGNRFIKIDRFKKVHKWRLRISIIIDNIGYYVIIPLAATSLSMAVGVTFLFAEKVNYKLFFIYITIGRTLILSLFVIGINTISQMNFINLLLIMIPYIVSFGFVLYKLIRNRHVFVLIKEKELELSKKLKEENENIH